jgi:hypothetical protein
MQSCLKNTHMGWLNSLNVRLGSSVNRLKKNVDAGATVKAESSKSGILFAPDILKLKFPQSDFGRRKFGLSVEGRPKFSARRVRFIGMQDT